MIDEIRLLAADRGKEQAVRRAATELIMTAAEETLDTSSEAEAIEVWRGKQREWLALCKQDLEIKSCVLRRAVQAVSSDLHDLLDSHGVWE